MLARRDTGAKETVALSDIAKRVPALLDQIQASTLLQSGHLLNIVFKDFAIFQVFPAYLQLAFMILSCLSCLVRYF